MNALAPLKFSLDGPPDEVGPFFTVIQHGVDPVKRAGRQASRRLFFVDPPASHVAPLPQSEISDITY